MSTQGKLYKKAIAGILLAVCLSIIVEAGSGQEVFTAIESCKGPSHSSIHPKKAKKSKSIPGDITDPDAATRACFVDIIPILEKGLNDSSPLIHPRGKQHIAEALLAAYQTSNQTAKSQAVAARRNSYEEIANRTETMAWGSALQARVDFFNRLGPEYAGDLKSSQKLLSRHDKLQTSDQEPYEPYGWSKGADVGLAQSTPIQQQPPAPPVSARQNTMASQDRRQPLAAETHQAAPEGVQPTYTQCFRFEIGKSSGQCFGFRSWNTCSSNMDGKYCWQRDNGTWDCYVATNMRPGEQGPGSSCSSGRIKYWTRVAGSLSPWPEP